MLPCLSSFRINHGAGPQCAVKVVAGDERSLPIPCTLARATFFAHSFEMSSFCSLIYDFSTSAFLSKSAYHLGMTASCSLMG